MKQSKLQLVACVAVHLAVCFFDSGITGRFNPAQIKWMTLKVYDEADVMECIRMYLVAEIPFFGTTLLDIILDSLPKDAPLPSDKFETYCLLNYICYQKSLFPETQGDLSKLSDVILEFANIRDKFGTRFYLTTKFKTGAMDKTAPKVTAFAQAVKDRYDSVDANASSNANLSNENEAASVVPVEAPKPATGVTYVPVPAINFPSRGGKRRNYKKRKTQRKRVRNWKHNTTLKHRNGRRR